MLTLSSSIKNQARSWPLSRKKQIRLNNYSVAFHKRSSMRYWMMGSCWKCMRTQQNRLISSSMGIMCFPATKYLESTFSLSGFSIRSRVSSDSDGWSLKSKTLSFFMTSFIQRKGSSYWKTIGKSAMGLWRKKKYKI